MSDPIPKDGGTEARDSDESLPDRLPPIDLPEELIRRRLARLDTAARSRIFARACLDSKKSSFPAASRPTPLPASRALAPRSCAE